MKEAAISITAIICLTLCFIFACYTMPQASKLFYAIALIIGGLGGFYIGQTINNARRRAIGLEPQPLRHPLHIVAGIIAPLSALESPALPPTLAGAYVVYEIRQSRATNNKDYLDILEFTIPAFATAAVMLVLHFLEVI